jgi:hypothetical protein
MVPVRFIAEALGADVQWREEYQMVVIYLDGRRLELVIGRLMEGMDVAAAIYNQRTFVPLRFVAEQLGAVVNWNPDTQTIEIIAMQ